MTQRETISFALGTPGNKAGGICLELSPEQVSVCEYDPESNKVLYLAESQMPGGTYSIEQALDQNRIRLKAYGQTLVNYSSAMFTVVPVAFYTEEHSRALLEFNCGKTGSDLILSDDITPDIKLIYSIPEELKSGLDKLLPNHHLKHKATVLSRLALQADEFLTEQMLVDISSSSIYIVVKKAGNLLLCNHYKVHSDEDILYYILFMLEQFDLNPLSVKVSLSGQCETESSLAKSLQKYIRQVRFVVGNKSLNRSEITNLPHQFYFSILNRTFCE
ncbi:MAG: DUF3822 family protein [Bacteroidetes bacterium]|nr:DUF3822 family protein [Bacteroidota bacterium]